MAEPIAPQWAAGQAGTTFDSAAVDEALAAGGNWWESLGDIDLGDLDLAGLLSSFSPADLMSLAEDPAVAGLLNADVLKAAGFSPDDITRILPNEAVSVPVSDQGALSGLGGADGEDTAKQNLSEVASGNTSGLKPGDQTTTTTYPVTPVPREDASVTNVSSDGTQTTTTNSGGNTGGTTAVTNSDGTTSTQTNSGGTGTTDKKDSTVTGSALGDVLGLAGIGGLLSNLLDEGDVETKISETGLTDTVGSSTSATTGGTSSDTTSKTTGGTTSLGTQASTSTTGVEDWAKQAGQDLLSYAKTLKPYERIDKGEGTVGGMLESGALGAYTNPFLESVLDPMRQINLEQRAQDSNQRAAKAVMGGAFGGSRAMIEDQYKDYLAGRAWNENEANIRSQAYKGALDQMSGDVNRNVADWTKFQEGGKDLLSAYTPALSGIAGVADKTSSTAGTTGQATTSDQSTVGSALGQNWSNTAQQSQQTAGTESAKTIAEPGASKIGTALGIAGTVGNLYNTFKTPTAIG